MIRDSRPETLALELPPLAVGLYRSYAVNGFERGGEMSAAIRAAGATDAGDTTVVAIDGPSAAFTRVFHRYLDRESVDGDLRERLQASLRTAQSRALRCRLAATAIGQRLGVNGERPFTYDCDHGDDIGDLAADERSHVSMARAATAFSPPHVAHRDAIREECMAGALDELPAPVVAVVGIDHLDGITSRLD